MPTYYVESTKSHDLDEDSDYEDFSSATVQGMTTYTRSEDNTNFEVDAVISFLTEAEINPEVHEYSY